MKYSPPKDRPIELWLRQDRRCVTLIHREPLWRELQPFLAAHGYALRARYQPDWTPSWRLTGEDTLWCEDSEATPGGRVMDAWSVKHQRRVALKRIRKDRYGVNELRISTYFATLQDPRNACIHPLDVLNPGSQYDFILLVMPLLHRLYDIDFVVLKEPLSFLEQLLQGLTFLHSHNIAHQDICVQNIMVDSEPLYPMGIHPLNPLSTPDFRHDVHQLRLSDIPVKYFFIDFGHSVEFQSAKDRKPGVERLGQYRWAPEYKNPETVDGFKLDVYCLGYTFWTLFMEIYDILADLVLDMTQERPEERPTAAEAYARLKDIISKNSSEEISARGFS